MHGYAWARSKPIDSIDHWKSNTGSIDAEVVEKLGIGPKVLCSENPKLIYGRMTGEDLKICRMCKA